MKKRTKILTFLFVALVAGGLWIAGNIDREINVIYDTSLAVNDTMLVTIDIGSSPNVALMLQCSDTVNAKITTYYGYGSGSRISVAAADTVNATGTTVPVSKGKVLRGYGLATDLIPGANKLYLKYTVNAVGTTSNFIRTGIITAK